MHIHDEFGDAGHIGKGQINNPLLYENMVVLQTSTSIGMFRRATGTPN